MNEEQIISDIEKPLSDLDKGIADRDAHLILSCIFSDPAKSRCVRDGALFDKN